MTDAYRNKNYVRRGIGVLLCSIPAALALACALLPERIPPARAAAGFLLAAAACLTGFLNIYLTFVRPKLYEKQHGSMEGYRFRSGLSLVGTVLLTAGCIVAFGDRETGSVALLAALIDPGGSLWIPFLTWKQHDLWDT